MKSTRDIELVRILSRAQKGVLSTADLRTAFAERHSTGFKRRVEELIGQGTLSRYTRGFYVTAEFDLGTLSQRIAPSSCVSFETVLASALIIGTNPERRIVSTKVGRTRRYRALGYEIEHLGISEGLDFAYQAREGVRYAGTEKALLDLLYFHLRGRRSAIDIYSDINLQVLDEDRIREYLAHYQNPKFVAFAKRALKLK